MMRGVSVVSCFVGASALRCDSGDMRNSQVFFSDHLPFAADSTAEVNHFRDLVLTEENVPMVEYFKQELVWRITNNNATGEHEARLYRVISAHKPDPSKPELFDYEVKEINENDRSGPCIGQPKFTSSNRLWPFRGNGRLTACFSFAPQGIDVAIADDIYENQYQEHEEQTYKPQEKVCVAGRGSFLVKGFSRANPVSSKSINPYNDARDMPSHLRVCGDCAVSWTRLGDNATICDKHLNIYDLTSKDGSSVIVGVHPSLMYPPVNGQCNKVFTPSVSRSSYSASPPSPPSPSTASTSSSSSFGSDGSDMEWMFYGASPDAGPRSPLQSIPRFVKVTEASGEPLKSNGSPAYYFQAINRAHKSFEGEITSLHDQLKSQREKHIRELEDIGDDHSQRVAELQAIITSQHQDIRYYMDEIATLNQRIKALESSR